MLSRIPWFALLANAALPVIASLAYARFALTPERFDDAYSEHLAALFIAQFPLALLGAAFAGVSYIEGPAWRRVLIYLIVIAIVAAVGGFWHFALDSALGPILAWAIAMQLVILVFVGSQPDLACARIEAATEDAVNLSILTVWIGLPVIVGAVLLAGFANGHMAWRTVSLEWSDVAWIGALYFALRAWSAAYVYLPAFEARGRKGYFTRPWIEKTVRLGRKPSPKDPAS